MGVRNDSRRADKAAKRKPVELDSLVRYARVKVPWSMAVDLGFATVSFPDKGDTTASYKPVYTPIKHPEVTAYNDGVLASGAAVHLAILAAPRAVRKRLKGIVA